MPVCYTKEARREGRQILFIFSHMWSLGFEKLEQENIREDEKEEGSEQFTGGTRENKRKCDQSKWHTCLKPSQELPFLAMYIESQK